MFRNRPGRRRPPLPPPWLAVGLGLLCAACAESGDRKPVHPARGKVLFEGNPPAHALVVLHPLDDPSPDAPKPSARVGEDGSFRLTTYTTHDGGPEGRYAVTVLLRKRNRLGEEEGGSLLPPRYARPESSDLRVEIRKGENELPTLYLKR